MPVQACCATQTPGAKAQANHRVALRPVPAPMALQATKQAFVAFKQLGQGVEEQRFASGAGAI